MRTLNVVNVNTACWIARLGSFTAAAERLHTTQPAISARVRELESALGVSIFIREGRGVQLSVEGRDFVRKAEPLLRQLEELSRSIADPAHAPALVRIGCGTTSMQWLPSAVIELQRTHPRITYELETNYARQLLDRLDSGKLDVAIVAIPLDPQRHLAISLGFERFWWVASRKFVSSFPGLSTEALLRKGPLWCMQKGSYYWKDAVQRVLDCGASIDSVNSTNEMGAALQMVMHGSGIGLLPESLTEDQLAAGTLVRLGGLQESDPIEFHVVCEKRDPEPVILHIMNTVAAMSPFARDRQAKVPIGPNGSASTRASAAVVRLC